MKISVGANGSLSAETERVYERAAKEAGLTGEDMRAADMTAAHVLYNVAKKTNETAQGWTGEIDHDELVNEMKRIKEEYKK